MMDVTRGRGENGAGEINMAMLADVMLSERRNANAANPATRGRGENGAGLINVGMLADAMLSGRRNANAANRDDTSRLLPQHGDQPHLETPTASNSPIEATASSATPQSASASHGDQDNSQQTDSTSSQTKTPKKKKLNPHAVNEHVGHLDAGISVPRFWERYTSPYRDPTVDTDLIAEYEELEHEKDDKSLIGASDLSQPAATPIIVPANSSQPLRRPSKVSFVFILKQQSHKIIFQP